MIKRMLKQMMAVLLILTLVCSLWGCTSSVSETISEPFQYAGYNEAEYSGYTKTSEYVEMSDGTKIAVDIYLPGETDTGEAFPVIFQYTPYGRAYVIPDSVELSVAEKIGVWYYTGTWDRIFDRVNTHDTVYGSSGDEIAMFLSKGYAYVCADMRGTGASFGHMVDFSPKFGEDGKELIDWMAEQDWCDGNVGMCGGSYLGYSQLVTAAQQPEALKCIIPEMTPLDGYTGEIRPGGIFLYAYANLDTINLLEMNSYLPDEYSYPTAPVVDEDGDGEYSDEIPLDLDGDGQFTDDYNYPDDPDDEPQYADGKQREHIYYLATKEHEQNMTYTELVTQAQHIDDEVEYEGETLSPYTVSASAGIAEIAESGIAVYAFGGWMDAFARGATEIYATLKETNNARLLIGAGYHEENSPYWEYCGEDEDEIIEDFYTERLRFFDRYLKGIENGIDTEDPVVIYNMNGDGWRTETDWPLEDQTETTLYFDADNTLSSSLDAEGADDYTVDFTTSANYGESYDGARYLMTAPDVLPDRTEEDEKCLTYTTEPLTEDVEVTGHAIVNLWVSSTADTGDFYVYLEDVDEDGTVIPVADGLLNAQYHALCENDEMIDGGDSDLDILPDLPWHGYETADCDTDVFADDAIVNLQFDLLPTSWTFQEGHSIRISIACADYPTFALTPELCPTNDPEDPQNIIPTVTVYRTKMYASSIQLPVIKRE